MPDFAFDTGLAPLPDVGTLSYNGVTFSSLFRTTVNFVYVKDRAERTVKSVRYTLEATGMVTLEAGNTTIDNTFEDLRVLLSAQAGQLTYSGKGMGNPLVVNPPGIEGIRDVAWGPKPELLHFQPLGASRSALVRWQVVFELAEFAAAAAPGGLVALRAIGQPPLLQFNEDITITYDDDCYAGISIKGTAEMPLTRTTQANHNLTTTIDAYRQRFMTTVLNSIDTTRMRITSRAFNVSRDKRTMEWEIAAQELPPMDLPMFCPSARGTYSMRPTKSNPGLLPYICSLRATYTVRKDQPRRIAWWAFISLWQWKMGFGRKFQVPVQFRPKKPVPPQPPTGLNRFNYIAIIAYKVAQNEYHKQMEAYLRAGGDLRQNAAIPIYFGFDEGLYLDSKTVSFEAAWKLIVPFESTLVASGFCQYPTFKSGGARIGGVPGVNVWTLSMQDVVGWKGYMANSLDPNGDVIVDFGGGQG